MLDLTHLLTFTLTAVLITAAPGPDNLMVLSVGVSKGRRNGMAFGLGCATGCLSHTLLAVLGVSAMVAASPVAFTALKWAGGAYLMWLGFNALRGHDGVASAQGSAASPVSAPTSPQAASTTTPQASPWTLFFKGMLANAINPKVVLFFLSFLPQFVLPEHGSLAWQLGVLGVIFSLQAAVIFTALAWFAGSIGARLNRTPRLGVWLDRLSGTVFVALGLRMATSR